MSSFISSLIPYAVLLSNTALVISILAIIFRNSWGAPITYWLGKHSLTLAFLVALAAVVGSLFYSNVIGFEPCVLCWWIRIFLFPLVIIFSVALWKHDNSAFRYAVPLAFFAALISIYFSYTSLGGGSILPCTAEGGTCSRVYVKVFGYITIPFMSLTASLFILLFAWLSRLVNKSSNT